MSDYKQTRDAAGKVTTQYDKMLRNLTGNNDLVKRLRDVESNHSGWGYAAIAADRIEQLVATCEELEAKLAKAMQIIEAYEEDEGYVPRRVVSLYEELSSPMKGQKDEWKCPINHPNCEENCGNYGCGN